MRMNLGLFFNYLKILKNIGGVFWFLKTGRDNFFLTMTEKTMWGKIRDIRSGREIV